MTVFGIPHQARRSFANQVRLLHGGLVAWYRLDEASGSYLSSAGASAPDLTATSTPVRQVPTFQGGVGFGGTGSAYAGSALSGSDIPTGAGARTVACWYKGTDTNKQALVNWGSAGTRNWCGLYANGNSASDIAAFFYGDDHFAGVTLNDGVWHHLMLTYDGGTAWQLYFDGALVNLGSLGGALTTTATGPFYIATESLGPGNTLRSGTTIDEVTVWNRVLNPTEIRVLYESGRV